MTAIRALRFDRIGSLDALHLAATSRPLATEGEVVVQVRAAGLNPSDFKNVLGKFPYTTVPRTPGRDFAGVVVAGPDELVGREVWGSGRELGFTRDGSHAEYVALAATGVSTKPANLSFEQAAACGVPYLTAWEVLERSRIGAEDAVLIIGMGAVGAAARAVAAARGARVLVAVRRTEQAEQLRGRGIDTIVLGEQLAMSVREYFGDGAEVVFDTTGFWLPAAIPALAAGGRVAIIAAPGDGHERVPVLDFYRRGSTLLGVNSARHDTTTSAVSLTALRPLFESGAVPAPTGIVVRPLDQAVETYRDLAGGATDKFVFVPEH
ncbi:NADPH:quinone reductase-like Zn-dependent oxidoreductase [Rhodococcus sp. OK611]|jgi:NADPH:quinone reductase|uniref:quinone oxidoreductase family protein n=1 Tax=unclassified Rhodococcus (in: high G+C Gram-positive bacteria) TaxID=192944 RepID=UPI000BD55086|nr:MULTISPECIES: zinc-binding alcohol dehydrogenase family protein [unclassified Rhodococcus (in: high G+C Gram-positive bacteria)]PTR39021.1 NADPH:quinone reductase-like Zn-dependent oxidoreductase [Rhodococcus sp. OK611]SNX92807.1 NADPH:quinone reductase [Rhodococcus sp. OK270]